MSSAGDPGQWIEHEAAPDGCAELIIRTSGCSKSGDEQPSRFLVGLSELPVRFAMSGDASFAAVRLWPWALEALMGIRPVEAFGRWIIADGPALDPIFAALPDLAIIESVLATRLGGHTAVLGAIGSQIIESASVADMVRRTGMPPRRLQRWFARYVGLSPRRYLRLIRFQKAFEQLATADRLAIHAAEHGYSDQAHMAREFRRLSGQATRVAKARSHGPFLD